MAPYMMYHMCVCVEHSTLDCSFVFFLFFSRRAFRITKGILIRERRRGKKYMNIFLFLIDRGVFFY